MRILILCTGNSCRSQMAQGFLRSYDSSIEVYSAGTHPASVVHPLAIKVMAERGIDISDQKPQNVDTLTALNFDFVITVCSSANEQCPTFSGKVTQRWHIGFDDPAAASGSEAQQLEVFRRVCDEINEAFLSFYRSQVRGVKGCCCGA